MLQCKCEGRDSLYIICKQYQSWYVSDLFQIQDHARLESQKDSEGVEGQQADISIKILRQNQAKLLAEIDWKFVFSNSSDESAMEIITILTLYLNELTSGPFDHSNDAALKQVLQASPYYHTWTV